MIRRTLATLLTLAATPAFADTGCDTVTFSATPAQSIHIAQIKPGPHATFLSGRDACPNDTPACRQSAYVIPGDRLLTGDTHGPYTCAYYTNGKTEAAGWLPSAQLQPQPTPLAKHHAWLGTWHNGDNTLIIKQAGRHLAVTGQAYWPSKSDPNGHEGHIDSQAPISGRQLSLSDADDPQGCKITLILIAENIIAHDNNACGGANVSFTGIYLR